MAQCLSLSHLEQVTLVSFGFGLAWTTFGCGNFSAYLLGHHSMVNMQTKCELSITGVSCS